MKNQSKPFQTYFGGKESAGTYQKIINLIPPHDVFIECFLGNGTIYRKKKTASQNIGIDKDPEVIRAWLGTSSSLSITLINSDAISYLTQSRKSLDSSFAKGLKFYLYLDPPYLMHTRKSSKNRYKHELNREGHIKLLELINSYPPGVLIGISTYPNKLYDTTLLGWNSITYENQTRGGKAIEKFYFNYPFPEQLHDYSYLGDDFRERELISGMIKRNTRKIKNMPILQRNALIESLRKNNVI